MRIDRTDDTVRVTLSAEEAEAVRDDLGNIWASKISTTGDRLHSLLESVTPEHVDATIAAHEIELDGGDVMLQELSVGDPIEIEKQTGPLGPGIWVITAFQADDRSRARVRKLSVEEIQAARRREANARIYE